MDPISLATGAVIFGGGWVLGRIARLRSDKPKASPYVCTCGHPLSDHDRESSRCVGVHIRRKYSSQGIDIGKHPVSCTCQQYIGERPVDITSLGLPGFPSA